jgi:hypothetical protein
MTVDQKHGRQNDGDDQEQIHARHAITAVLSATRMMALRERGLPATSASLGRIRSKDFSFMGCGTAKGARRS